MVAVNVDGPSITKFMKSNLKWKILSTLVFMYKIIGKVPYLANSWIRFTNLHTAITSCYTFAFKISHILQNNWGKMYAIFIILLCLFIFHDTCVVVSPQPIVTRN